ncbi:MAG TPA: lysophospholipid acyltransferase family protein [Acidobacteriota bacterium]|nr:lysophospholipid acyltransferase family protein [Acidobacteriota bacterium]HNC45168.1 lysophospholipid acyltransferase family protein [Acidobacteriota bacterium]HND19761.1 lysophospholipid acyltransferase family protein [Acidobacteriota bacterium]HNG93208.1 lysophospholipid acyltransferase family protein [Acidobacteriota bacterium]HNH82017.1 lysophospholipid acyltransferase family protein [Acidobacteriota bacterium]
MKFITAIRLAVMMVLAAIFFSIPLVIALPLSPKWRRKVMFYPWFGFANSLRLLFGATVQVTGREYVGGEYEQHHLYICNHLSMADIPILVTVYPLPFVAKKEVMKVPIIGWAGLMSGNVSFDRSDPVARKKVVYETLRRIKEVNSIYIFPEGTRSKTGIPKAEPYLSMMAAAWTEKIDVIPMAIHGSKNVLTDLTSDVRIKLDPPMRCADYPNADRFAQACWSRVIEMFYELNADAKAAGSRTAIPAEMVPPTPATASTRLNEVFESVSQEIHDEPSTTE